MMPHYHIQHRTTALTLASKRRCADIVKLLLKTRFDVSARLQGKSAIQLVARYGYAEVIALLLDAGAEVERRENSLWCAIDCNKAHLIPLLFQHRSNIEAEAYECKRLLHRAAMQGNVAALETLLTSGAKKKCQICMGTSSPASCSPRRCHCCNTYAPAVGSRYSRPR
ncbi:ankyrin repeat-containing domain protein [Aspergillus flavus]|uniref:Ankyrin repeat-containing domain protein n=1 Tax=Aspergillus flavus (strain ATCC 200026 / FGSC A1120 / IAM 13836 / NRRL 3357 / JCM 12722 / SRRC 167) TaxID=332952 RepID=A0A7U2MQS5_ASPFN|nr:ankyrin repeat-containing domain protein [Aspergillus flavus]